MWYFAQMMMYLDTSQKSPIRYDTIQALKNVSRFDTDPQKVYLDTRYVSNIAILCTTANRCQKYVNIEMPNQQFRIQAKNEQYFLKNPKFKESAACTNS